MHYKRFKRYGDPDIKRPKKTMLSRFQGKYQIDDQTGCWNWTAAKDQKGYGAIKSGETRHRISAHRAAYQLFIGEIPDGEGSHGTCVLHRCDNPSCVNPEHLFLGTVSENNKDMQAKGRARNQTTIKTKGKL